MKKRVIYTISRREDVKLYNFTANRTYFRTMKSCGKSDNKYDMNILVIPVFKNSDTSCSPMPGEFDSIPT